MWPPMSLGRAVGPNDYSCTYPLWDRSFINHLYVFSVIAYFPRRRGLFKLGLKSAIKWINLVKANPQNSSRDSRTFLVATGTNVHVSTSWNPSSATCRRLEPTPAAFGRGLGYSLKNCQLVTESPHSWPESPNISQGVEAGNENGW